jgi:anti-anti-sigma regulatory factor
MVLCGLKDRVRSIFEIARLDTVFTIAGSRDLALKA